MCDVERDVWCAVHRRPSSLPSVHFNAVVDIGVREVDCVPLCSGPKVNNVEKLSALRNAGMNIGVPCPAHKRRGTENGRVSQCA